MESVMNFLADYYIWFFVGAIVLCFALIGFIIDARKKKKNEFKGEAISEPNTQNAPATPVSNEPQVVGSTVNVDGATLGTSNTVSDSTMEINDIPMAPTTPQVEEPAKVEFYAGPVEMPTVEQAPVNNMAPTSNETSTIGEPISFDNSAVTQPVTQEVAPVQQDTIQNTNNQNNIN